MGYGCYRNVPNVELGLRFRRCGRMGDAIAVGCRLGGWQSIRKLFERSVFLDKVRVQQLPVTFAMH